MSDKCEGWHFSEIGKFDPDDAVPGQIIECSDPRVFSCPYSRYMTVAEGLELLWIIEHGWGEYTDIQPARDRLTALREKLK